MAGAAVWLLLSGEAGVRYSADHAGTVPMWFRWLPVLVGLVLARLVLPATPYPVERPPAGQDARAADRWGVRLEAAVLSAVAVLFAATLWWAGGGEPAHTALKLAFLLAVPVVTFRVVRARPLVAPLGPPGPWRRYGPAIPVAAWLALTYAGPLAVPPSDYARTVDLVTLVATVVVVFLVNALLEEVFYRRWLQTRWEAVLGRWPAIVVTSLLWAAWHPAIQGGDFGPDLASAFVNQGVQGLFLGYLWSRYRLMWPLLTVHGAMNAAPILLGLL